MSKISIHRGNCVICGTSEGKCPGSNPRLHSNRAPYGGTIGTLAARAIYKDVRIQASCLYKPNEGLRIFIPHDKELVDRGDEIVDAEERITANAFVGEFREPAFNQVQPAAACWHIVDYKAAMFPQPGFDFGGAMRPVVVHDDV